MIRLTHARIFTPEETITDGWIDLDDGIILGVGAFAAAPLPEDTPVVDLNGLCVSPGWIDIQINGAFGLDFTENPDTIWPVAARLPELGVTAFLPTIVTAPFETYDYARQVWRSGPPSGQRGARVLGLHIEGPFLNPQKKGAHNPDYLQKPKLKPTANWSPDGGVRLVTLAPEQPGALELIQHLHGKGIVVSAGHSLASTLDARAAIDAGVTCGTHLFNAMPTLDHRAPGLTGALLTADGVWTGIIADGIHVHPDMVAVALRCKGPQRLTLVTDAMAALGMPPGPYRLGDFDVIVDANSARLANGTLAGSILTLSQAIRNLQAFTGCGWNDALRCATLTPAELLGLPKSGRLQPGADADLTVFDAESGAVAMTIIGGEIVYRAAVA